MDVKKLYSELIIIPLEEKIKSLRRNTENKKEILKLQEILQEHYKKYYNLKS